jgi:inorganic phosphate transporter, PiT family
MPKVGLSGHCSIGKIDMYLLSETLPFSSSLFLLLALGLALSFEFVNGFHDTANAVATVIYTNSLRPWAAVIWSGIWNLIGVLTSAGAVAFSILALLPSDMVLHVGSSTGFAMVFALLLSAIIWNLGTWYLGLPASSSHTLIGSILGVGLMNALFTTGHPISGGVNWTKAGEVFSSLLISPIIGFISAALLLLAAKLFIRKPALYQSPPNDRPPPLGIRALLVLTCTGVSYAHGSNDGQKGMGLILLILIGILPASYAMNLEMQPAEMQRLQSSALLAQSRFGPASMDAATSTAELSNYLKPGGVADAQTISALATINSQIITEIQGKTTFRDVAESDRQVLRSDCYLVAESIGKLNTQKYFASSGTSHDLAAYETQLDAGTKFIPVWVKFAVALALGLGTTIGWKRIVRTVGERIGKQHLTYAQGASAEVVTMLTIGLATHSGLPVSTTHVLSSGVAGTMAANRSGLQMTTLRNIAAAWLLTLPVCVVLGSAAYAAGLLAVFHATPAILIALVAAVTIGYITWRFNLIRRIRSFSAEAVPSANSPLHHDIPADAITAK